MNQQFPTDYQTILEKMDQVNPLKYGKTRNFVDGDVTYLSPYISRGVISTKQVLEHVLSKGYKSQEIEPFVRELCWRDYFQRVGQIKNLNQEIKQAQDQVSNFQLPSAVVNATTGIIGIDEAIEKLYRTGYMHNHCRMYTASLVCNISKSHWLMPARWMYYHLLDGDWASNACSWQWVSGANSSKKYYANQENINKYTKSVQIGTYLDKTYDELQTVEIPAGLVDTIEFVPELELPDASAISLISGIPTLIYNYYNLDPLWRKDETCNRILLIDVEHFSQYPVGKNGIQFMMDLRMNIPDIRVYVGTFESLVDEYHLDEIIYKEHPLNIGYSGTEDPRDWIVDEITGYFPSFFAYWKKVEKVILKKYG